MALIIETYLVCNRCGVSTFGEGHKERPGYEQRIQSKKNGWVNHDVCPDCVYKNGRGNKKVKLTKT